MSSIRFFNDDVNYRILNRRKIRSWLLSVAEEEGYTIASINIILCSDNQLLSVNKEHLKHDFYTDIITFDYSQENILEGELYVSIDRVKSNAKSQQVNTSTELHRVFVHGLLHMCGFSDKTAEEKTEMRQLENHYLKQFQV
ncbi:MAG: rRNA maturation RNase YbeY [Saprospiraceae bacterium]